MRILYIVHQFFPLWYTGTERFVLNISKQMQRMGHHVEVLTYGRNDDENFSDSTGVKIKKYIYENIPVISIKHKSSIQKNSMPLNIFDEELQPILNKIIASGKYDVIHVAHPFRLASVINSAAFFKIPVVLTLTDFWLMCPKAIAVTETGELCHFLNFGMKCVTECYANSMKKEVLKRFNDAKQICDTVDCITTSTHFLQAIIEKNYSCSKIVVIPFGKDYKNITQKIKHYDKNSDITIGFLSTLQPHKGAHILLEAFKKANMRNLRIKIYGHYFDYENYYLKLKREYTCDRVEFCGAYKYEDFQKIFDNLDIIAIPSLWWENSPLVMLRALAHNIPVIVPDLGGMTEIVKDGVNGFVFIPGNSDSLLKILIKIGENPALLNEIKSKIQFPPRIEEEAFEYELLYNKLIQRKGS